MFKAVLLLIIAMASIQTGATVAKSLFPLTGPAGTSALRLFFATAILWGVFRPWRKKLTSSQLRSVAIYGVSLGLMNLLFYFALERIPLGIAVALEFTGPLALSIFKSRRLVDYLWALLAMIGILLLLPQTEGSASLDPIGLVFAAGAGMFWAFYILYGQKAGSELEGSLASTYGMAFAAMVVLPFGVFQKNVFNPALWPLALAVGFLSSALPYTLEMYSLKRIPAKTFGILMSLEPAIGALAGLVFLREALSLTQWLAILCVICASLGSTLKKSA